MKADPSAGVHAHAARSSPKTARSGGYRHTLQLIALCTSDCKNKDQLIIISPCRVSKCDYTHVTYRKNEPSCCHRQSCGQCQDREQVSKLPSLLSSCFAQAKKPTSCRVRLEPAPREQGKAAASLSSHPMDHAGQQDTALRHKHVAFPNFWLLVTCSLFVERNWSLKEPHAVVLGASGFFYSSKMAGTKNNSDKL